MKNAKDGNTSLKTDDISTSLESRYTEVLVSGNNQELQSTGEGISFSQEPEESITVSEESQDGITSSQEPLSIREGIITFSHEPQSTGESIALSEEFSIREAITASQEPQSTGVDKTVCDKINEKDSDSDIERRNIEDIDGINVHVCMGLYLQYGL